MSRILLRDMGFIAKTARIPPEAFLRNLSSIFYNFSSSAYTSERRM